MQGLRAAALLLGLAALWAPAAAAQAPGAVYEYHTYATLGEDLDHLAAEHPDLARLEVIGRSPRGLNLWTLEIANFSDPGLAAKPVFYLDGGHHGNEALGIELAYRFAEGLLEGYAEDPVARGLVDGAHIFVTPLVNPDGKVANTRQNGNLVNLNRNYPFHWDERGTDPAPPGGNYAGPRAGSEPETQANMAFIQEKRPSVYVSLHTGTFDLVRPFGYAPDEPVPDEALYQRLFEFADAQGLPARFPGGSGESICWAYGAQGVFSILIEVYDPGDGSLPGPQVLPGPLTRAEVDAILAPPLAVLHHLLERAGDWGARLEAAFLDVEGDRGVLALRNAGLAPARNLTLAATGADPLEPLPRDLDPDAEARVAVRLEGPAHARIHYERLAVQPEDPEGGRGTAEAFLERHTGSLEPRALPLPAALALAALALAARRLRG